MVAPTCTLDATLAADGSYSVAWDIHGDFNSPTNIELTPPNANQTSYAVTNNNGIWTNIIPS